MQTPIHSYAINLPSRTDRREEMEQQLRRAGWHSTQFVPANRPAAANGFPSVGARGCFLSHLAALKRGLLTQGHVLIMEDDLDFVPGFPVLWDSICTALERTEWSIFYPGHDLEMTGNLFLVPPSRAIIGSHFVLFNRSVVQAVINALELILSRPPGHALGGPMHVDGAYSTIRQQNPHLLTYACSPVLGRQRPSRSDIADLKFFDRIDILRPMISKLRRLKISD